MILTLHAPDRAECEVRSVYCPRDGRLQAVLSAAAVTGDLHRVCEACRQQLAPLSKLMFLCILKGGPGRGLGGGWDREEAA